MNEKPMDCDSACDSSHVGGFSGGSVSAEETCVSSGIVDDAVSAPENVENFHSLTEPRRCHTCGLCGKEFPDMTMLEEHQSLIREGKNCTPDEKPSLTVHQETSVASNFFGSTFFGPVAQLENAENLRTLWERFYECGLCGEKFPYRAMLEEHHSRIDGVKNFTPEKPLRNIHQEASVGSGFPDAAAQLANFTNFLRLEQPRYECEVCGKKYHCREALETHRRVYEGRNCTRDRPCVRLRPAPTYRESFIRTAMGETRSCDMCKRPVLRRVHRNHFMSARKQTLCTTCKKALDFEITIK